MDVIYPNGPSLFAPIADERVSALKYEMDQTGIGVLHDAVSADLLADARKYITDELDRNGHQYFGHFGAAWLKESPLAALGDAPAFKDLLRGLYNLGVGRPAPVDEVFPALRVVAGAEGHRHANRYHYDSYVVTALVPLITPPETVAERGDLVMYPNTRRVRPAAVVNVIEKAVIETGLARRALASPATQRRMGARAVPVVPGNIYFFWGYRSLHGNRTCDPDQVRSTALFHYGDPHALSTLKRLSQWRHRAKWGRRNNTY